jgi:hypothetical protein
MLNVKEKLQEIKMLNAKDKLQEINELENKVNRLGTELANDEYNDYIFKRSLNEIENDLTQAKENLKEKLEKIVKSIEGKDDTNSLKIAYFLMGYGYSDNNFNLQSRGISRYLTGEQLNICYKIRENEDERVSKINRIENDNAKLQEFIKFVNDYNEYHKTNIQITGI